LSVETRGQKDPYFRSMTTSVSMEFFTAIHFTAPNTAVVSTWKEKKK